MDFAIFAAPNDLHGLKVVGRKAKLLHFLDDIAVCSLWDIMMFESFTRNSSCCASTHMRTSMTRGHSRIHLSRKRATFLFVLSDGALHSSYRTLNASCAPAVSCKHRCLLKRGTTLAYLSHAPLVSHCSLLLYKTAIHYLHP